MCQAAAAEVVEAESSESLKEGVAHLRFKRGSAFKVGVAAAMQQHWVQLQTFDYQTVCLTCPLGNQCVWAFSFGINDSVQLHLQEGL